MILEVIERPFSNFLLPKGMFLLEKRAYRKQVLLFVLRDLIFSCFIVPVSFSEYFFDVPDRNCYIFSFSNPCLKLL